MSSVSRGGTATTAAAATASSGADASTPGVWTQLLANATRKNKEINSTLIVMGDKGCGKSSLLAKFTDRVSGETLSTASAASSFAPATAGSLLAAGQATSAPASKPALDYSYCNVKNRYGAASEKDEVVARMHVWEMGDETHATLLPTLLAANASPSAQSASAPGTAAAPSPSSAGAVAPALSPRDGTAGADAAALQLPLDPASISSAVFALCIDLSEPWRAIDSAQRWLDAVGAVMQRTLNALPASSARSLRDRVSRYIQGFHAPPQTNSDITTITDANGTSAPDSSPASLEVDPSIPAVNFGVPLLLVGCKTDAFARQVRAASAGGATKAGPDEQFDFLARKLRRLCLQYGAALILTSSARGSVGQTMSSPAAKGAQAAVNIDVLQYYIYHRLYRFPLHPASSSGVVSSSDSTAAVADTFKPRLVGSPEDDFGLWIPAGLDTDTLLTATASSSLSASIAESTALDEIIRDPRRGRSAARGPSAPLQAEDNAVFLKNVKQALEQGGGVALQAATPAQHARHPTMGGSLKTAAAPSAGAGSAAAGAEGGAPGAAATPTPAPGGPRGSISGVAGGGPPKQTVVKQFFRSLLNNTSKGGTDGGTKQAAAHKAARANAEKEMQRIQESGQPSTS